MEPAIWSPASETNCWENASVSRRFATLSLKDAASCSELSEIDICELSRISRKATVRCAMADSTCEAAARMLSRDVLMSFVAALARESMATPSSVVASPRTVCASTMAPLREVLVSSSFECNVSLAFASAASTWAEACWMSSRDAAMTLTIVLVRSSMTLARSPLVSEMWARAAPTVSLKAALPSSSVERSASCAIASVDST